MQETRVTDVGIVAHLIALKALTALNFRQNVGISNDCIPAFASLTALRDLDLSCTQVSSAPVWQQLSHIRGLTLRIGRGHYAESVITF